MYRLILLLAALCISTPTFAESLSMVEKEAPSAEGAPAADQGAAPSAAADDDDSSKVASANDDDSAGTGAPIEGASAANEVVAVGDMAAGSDEANLRCKPADAGPAEGFDKWDQVFGKYVVSPIATFLFWDAWFWDNDEENAAEFKVVVGSINSDADGCAERLAAKVADLSERDNEAAAVFVGSLPLPLTIDFVPKAEAEKLQAELLSEGFESSLQANTVNFPIVVLWLIFGACFFTLRMNFINLRGFRHAITVTSGAYDNPDEEGEITHFQALSAALSATVGLGNIAGVAIAVAVGGPGAVFWMVLAGFLGMSSKFTECTLGQMYRVRDDKGNVSGGPMQYLHRGLEEMGAGGLGKVLAVLFAVMCIGGSFGGGNMFQANQSAQLAGEVVPIFGDYPWLYGVLLAVAVGMVIIGGIKRIGMAASAIVPAMCGIYVIAGLVVLFVNASEVPAAFGVIISSAFTTSSVAGGAIGVLIRGFRRAAFSNEAGVGSAAIAHSAASTEEPVREGIVALLEPFIDTIVICTMTGLVIVTSGVYTDESLTGIAVTAAAFATVIPWFPIILSIAAVLFAFSTMISWSYYGERCWTSLFGTGSSLLYKLLFLICVFLGSVFSLGSVLDFSDLMILGMAFPNILGCLLLSGKVRASLDTYMDKLGRGEFKITK
jgi:alanine or glycine:cation symporter, AGCS family